MSINAFKVETLQALKENVEVLAQNLKFSSNMINNLIKDELRQGGVELGLEGVPSQPKEAQAIEAAPVAQIEAPKEEPKAEVPEVKEDPFIASIEAQAQAEIQKMEEEKKEETEQKSEGA